MKKRFLILSFLFVLIFNSCSDDSINLAGTTWTSAKDWYGKTRLSFEEGTPYLRSFLFPFVVPPCTFFIIIQHYDDSSTFFQM